MARRKLETKSFEEVFIELLQLRKIINENVDMIVNMKNDIKASKDKELKNTYRMYIKELKSDNKFLIKKFNKIFNKVKDIEMKV